MTSSRRSVNPRKLLRRHNLHPSKGLGQHFLVDESVLDRIVAASEISPRDLVLEVGPGLGTLTQRLATRAARVIAVELDRKMLDIFADTLQGYANVELVQGDILETDPAQLVGPWVRGGEGDAMRYQVVANLPYYITSAVIRHLLSARIRPESMTLMVQHEVAQRIVAQPGDLSLLAISVQVYGTPTIVCRVPRVAFLPVPKVDSAVLHVQVREDPIVNEAELARFFTIVRAGFAQKRKQLHNSLTHNLSLQREEVLEALAASGIDPSRRPQTLSIPEWAELAKALTAKP